MKCYLSPRGYGFNAHFDAHIVTQLQIEGRKRWRYSVRPGVVDPLDNGFADEGGRFGSSAARRQSCGAGARVGR